MSQGIAHLFKKYGVVHIEGNGYIKSNNIIEVRNGDDITTDTITTKNTIIATGARPRMFQGIEVDRKRVITSKEALIPTEIPTSMIIMGAGAIGVEFAYFYNSFGSQITILEMQDRLLPIEDADISKELERNYRKQKIKLMTSTRVLSAKNIGDKVEVKIQKKDGTEETLTADYALNAIGIQPNVENIGLENIGLKDVSGFLSVDKNLLIAPNVFAIGDISGAP
jgi:dihydrolipoamide dehydrogenase